MVLAGATDCAQKRKTRWLVEMHATPSTPMTVNAGRVLAWCRDQGYQAYHVRRHEPLTTPDQIAHRGRCHLLLRPDDWAYAHWLRHLKQGAALSSVVIST